MVDKVNKIFIIKMEIFQTIIIIILFIVAIILIVFIIAQVEFPEPFFYTPFANGSRIRIRSLANGKYLRPVGTQSPQYVNCQDPAFRSAFNNNRVVADIDDPDERTTVWTVCQYAGSTSTPGNNAVYTLFNGNENTEEVLTFSNQLTESESLSVTSGSTSGCPVFNQSYPNIPVSLTDSIPYFSFVLQENGTTNNNGLKSSAYIIRSGDLTSNRVAVCTGSPSLFLYNGGNGLSPCENAIPSINPTNCTNANNCPPTVLMVPSSQVIGQINVLFYTFEIEVLPKTS